MNSSNTHHEFVTLYCNRFTQTHPTQDDSDAEASEDSDFPPCRIGNDLPLFSWAHCSSSSPSVAQAAPSQSRHLRAATSGIQQQIMTIPSDEESPQPQLRRQPNKGLGKTNIINTVHATSTVVLPKKVFLIYYSLHLLAILIANINVRVILLVTRSLC